MKKAMDVYLYSNLREERKIDSSLSLTNLALELDDQNLGALNHKATLLFRKKNPRGLIQVADRLIELSDKPFYLGQKALYLKLDGKREQAKEYYSRSLKQYDSLIRSDTMNFDLMIEYVSILEASGDSLKARMILHKMKTMDFEDYQLEMLDLYEGQTVSFERLNKYWKNEISYDQITVD